MYIKIKFKNKFLIIFAPQTKGFTMEFLNKNDRQQHFNNIRGVLIEKNDGKQYCSFTINVGHENPRPVNISVKKIDFDNHAPSLAIGEKVMAKFYLTSRKVGERWYTFANLLGIEKDVFKKPSQPHE